MRVAIGGLCHETSTFATTRTTVADFTNGFGLFRGAEILERFDGANICTGGFIEGAGRHGYELVPLLWGFAYPSGVIAADAYAQLKGEFLDRLRQSQVDQGPVDGVLLDQHGAMVVEGIEDADGDFIAAVRGVVGPTVPIVVTFDLHGNHSPQRVQTATAIVGFDTYPHVDMAERGREAADILMATLRGQVRPVMAWRPIPLFWSCAAQITSQPPMVEALAQVHALEKRPGIIAITIATGFPWSDIPHMGPSVIVTADADPALAAAVANELAEWIWDRREHWHCPPVSVTTAIEAGLARDRYPIILADHADNTGGGAPGDSTEILQTLLDRRLTNSLVLYIVDPEAVAIARGAGVGNRIELSVGGKSDPRQGAPVRMRAVVRAVSDGDFRYDGPMYAGLTGSMGPSAWIEQDGVHVVLVTAHEQPLGPAFARSLGINCPSMTLIAVKSAVHFQASFEAFAGSIFNVDARAIHTHDFAALPYRHRHRPMYPVDGA
ncbi:MAG TPA: M81 family metallopeptidase [Planctomycetaceae bacterium]|nr:M81 family metallopeptidase [Planctomycetaceae bacterium]